MKKIAVITSTRAEFGLLMPVINNLRKFECSQFNTLLVVTGTHLSKEYGYTIDEIKKFGLRIDHQVIISLKSEEEYDISFNQADTLVKFTELFVKERFDGIVILGDRYEMLAIAIAAGNTHTPIFHLCGGDVTEGAMDEWIRHAITKISYLHFPSNDKSYKRVIQLGEQPERVFNYGSTSIDNILNYADIDKTEVLKSLGLNDCKYAICTYHPVTMECDRVEEDIKSIINSIKEYPEIQFIVTKSNVDQGGAHINRMLDDANTSVKNLHVFSSLGVSRYLSLMREAEFVLGNSSSGIIEAPAFKVPTVNIGDRQRGRLQSETIINCEPNKKSICKAINKAMSKAFKITCKSAVSPYGDGNASFKIAKKIYDIVMKGNIDLKKTFYDFNAAGDESVTWNA